MPKKPQRNRNAWKTESPLRCSWIDEQGKKSATHPPFLSHSSKVKEGKVPQPIPLFFASHDLDVGETFNPSVSDRPLLTRAIKPCFL